MIAFMTRVWRAIRSTARNTWCDIRGCDRKSPKESDAIERRMQTLPDRIDRMISIERQTQNVIEREILGGNRQ